MPEGVTHDQLLRTMEALQFVLGVVQSAEGFPLMHTVHAGCVFLRKPVRRILTISLRLSG